MNTPRHRIACYGLSDPGLRRDNNEDHFIVADLTRLRVGVSENQVVPDVLRHDVGCRGTLLAVADGLGGYAGGEVASQIAVETLVQTLFEPSTDSRPLAEQLVRAVEAAHEAICRQRDAYQHPHMASTLTVVHVGPDQLTLAQIGDSRAYLWRDGTLRLLTEDQTFVALLEKQGLLNADEAAQHPNRHVLLQALGQEKAVTPEIGHVRFQHGDWLLLCTDGLSSYVSHDDIEAIFREHERGDARCQALIEAAYAAGGGDNITVLLAHLRDETNSASAQDDR